MLISTILYLLDLIPEYVSSFRSVLAFCFHSSLSVDLYDWSHSFVHGRRSHRGVSMLLASQTQDTDGINFHNASTCEKRPMQYSSLIIGYRMIKVVDTLTLYTLENGFLTGSVTAYPFTSFHGLLT